MFLFDQFTEFFKALSDTNRLRILLMLKKRSMCVCEIDEILEIALSTISTHLKQLKNQGLISSRKNGRWVVYSLSDDKALNELLTDVEKNIEDDPQYIQDINKLNSITVENSSRSCSA